MAKWVTESACSYNTWLVLELVLFAVFINGVLGKELHKKSIKFADYVKMGGLVQISKDRDRTKGFRGIRSMNMGKTKRFRLVKCEQWHPEKII